MPEPVTQVDLVNGEGRRVKVPLEQAAGLLTSGYRVETAPEAASALTKGVRDSIYGGAAGKIVTGIANAASGATLGLTDLAIDAFGGGDTLHKYNEANPYTALASQIVGGVAPALVPGLGALPAGQLAKAGSSVARVGEGAGIVGKTVSATAGSALEGAGQSAGAYLSQAALENKPLSAEGFLAATGGGALIGGAFGGGLSLAESSLVKAKTLFPRSEVTREAAHEAERAVSSELTSAATDGGQLLDVAREELRKNRLLKSANDLETQTKLNALKIAREEQRLAREQLRTQQATERAAKPKGGKRTRKTFEEPTASQDAPVPAASPAATPSPTTSGDDLLAQLQGTKQALDDGAELGQLSKRTLDDDIDDVIATSDPAHAKLLDATRELDTAKSNLDAWLGKYNKGGRYDSGEVAAFERSQASRDYAAGMRPKTEGYYTKVPDGEGNVMLPRGRQSVWRGSEEGRAIADAKTMAKLSPEERVAADIAVEEAAKRRGIGAEILEGATTPAVTPEASLDQTIAKALRSHVGEHADASEDIIEAAEVISRYENASANVAEILGPVAPPSSAMRAQALRDATAQQADTSATSIADMAKEMDRKLPADVAIPAPALSPVNPSNVGAATAADGAGSLKKAADVGTVLEVMGSLGLPGVPDLKSIPVIGPILSLYLKARAASAVYRRLGGKVPQNAETVVAKHAAKTRDRVTSAVDKILDASATGTRKARAAAGPLASLGVKLFDAKQEKADGKPTKGQDPYRDYRHRMHELATAQQPGVIAEAVRKNVPTADAGLHAALVEASGRKLAFLQSKAPKAMKLPTLLKGDGDWKPSKLQLQQFSRYIEAAENPVGVLEKLGETGQVTYEAAETLRNVYPQLYQAAQKRLIERAPELQQKLPYARRISLSILFQVPVDGTMDADFVSFLRQGQPANGAAPAQGSPGAAQPPTPTAAGPVMLGDRSMTRLDRRAGA